MNTVDASTYLYLPQFLSLVSYSFLNTGLLSFWLNLCPGILFFCCNIKWDYFLVSFSDSSLLVYKNAPDFWIFILYLATSPSPFIGYSSFFGGIFRLLYVQCHVVCCTLSFHLTLYHHHFDFSFKNICIHSFHNCKIFYFFYYYNLL